MQSLRPTYTVVVSLLFAIFLGFMTMVIGGMLLAPEIFNHPDYGISYFGAPGAAPAPYYIGIALTIVASGLLGYVLRSSAGRLAVFSRIFTLSAVFTTAIAITSYPQGHGWYWTHIWICIVLAVIYLGSIVWLWVARLGDVVSGFWTLVFVVGAVVLELSNAGTHVLGLYALAEIMMFVSILLLLGRSTLKLLPRE
jgi:hypothetical protein